MYRRGKTWYFRLPSSTGAVIRSTGVQNKVTASRVTETVQYYGAAGLRDWLLIDAIRDGYLGAAELHDAHETGRAAVESLRTRLRAERQPEPEPEPKPKPEPVLSGDPDLTQHIDQWLIIAGNSGNPETIARYRLHVRSLMPEGRPFLRSMLTRSAITNWAAGLVVTSTHRDPAHRVTTPATAGTKRRYLAALSSFCTYLVDNGFLEANLVHVVKRPPAGKPRCRYLELDQAKALAEAQPEPFRTLSILLHGTGLEISVAVNLRAGDFDFADHSIRGLGTKSRTRDRVVYVAKWAWLDLAKHVRGMAPGARVFPHIDRWRALAAHKAACDTLHIRDYTQHDARHTYAVRAIKAGASLEHVASQLGHGDTQMVVKVYGRYHPSGAERTAWEDRATEMDRVRTRSRRSPTKGGAGRRGGAPCHLTRVAPSGVGATDPENTKGRPSGAPSTCLPRYKNRCNRNR